MDTLQQLFQYIIHIDKYLFAFAAAYGIWTYALLFTLIFCETGLIVVPFLPGDSLLFAAGSLAAASDNTLDYQLLLILLIIAAILGNKVNYLIGRALGPSVFRAKDSWLFNKKHIADANQFYKTHGGKTIIFARFIPIIRTFAPFVAGIGAMSLAQFSFYNAISAVLWVGGLLSIGYFFGSIPFVKNNFSLVIYSIIFISFLPVIFSLIYEKFVRNRC